MAPLASRDRQILALQTTYRFITTTVVLGKIDDLESAIEPFSETYARFPQLVKALSELRTYIMYHEQPACDPELREAISSRRGNRDRICGIDGERSGGSCTRPLRIIPLVPKPGKMPSSNKRAHSTNVGTVTTTHDLPRRIAGNARADLFLPHVWRRSRRSPSQRCTALCAVILHKCIFVSNWQLAIVGRKADRAHLAVGAASVVAAQRITSSARNSSVAGMVRSSSFAVFRLMTSSNCLGCSTGRSAGFAPFRILST